MDSSVRPTESHARITGVNAEVDSSEVRKVSKVIERPWEVVLEQGAFFINQRLQLHANGDQQVVEQDGGRFTPENFHPR